MPQTIAVAASQAHLIPKPYEVGFAGETMTASIATTSLDEIGDIVELGYLPAGCAVIGYFIQTASLAASALVYKIQVAGVDSVTGITTGGVGVAAGALVVIPTAPLVLTAVSKVQLNITTVAVTPAAGVFNLTPLFKNA